MAIKKQEFYEGAALHLLVRTGLITSITYEPPFFTINDDVTILLKYRAKGRSPWGFTFMPEEQSLLASKAKRSRTIISLVCGSDGIAAFDYDLYEQVAPLNKLSIHISCYRAHREHYEIAGPKGYLPRKVAPSEWTRILDR